VLVVVGLLPLGVPSLAALAPSRCTRTWAGGDGAVSQLQFLARENWAEQATPGDSDVVCFSFGDTYLSGVTVTVGALEVGSSARLTIASSSVTIVGPTDLGGVTLDNAAEMVLLDDAEVSEGATLAASGRIESSVGASLEIAGTLAVTGELELGVDTRLTGGLEVQSNARLRLGDDTELQNEGVVTLAAGASVVGVHDEAAGSGAAHFDTLPRFMNAATAVVRIDAGAAPARLAALAFETDGAVDVRAGELQVHTGVRVGGGSVSGRGRVTIGQNAEVSVAALADWSPAVTELLDGGVLRLDGDRSLPEVAVGEGEVVLGGGVVSFGSMVPARATGLARISGSGVLAAPAEQIAALVASGQLEVSPEVVSPETAAGEAAAVPADASTSIGPDKAVRPSPSKLFSPSRSIGVSFVTPPMGMSPMVMTFELRVSEGSTGGLLDRTASVDIFNPSITSVFVTWAGTGSTAAVDGSGTWRGDADDVVVPPGSALLMPGTTTLQVPFRVVADLLDESDESFSISFFNGNPWSFGAVMITIADDDGGGGGGGGGDALTLTPSAPSTVVEGGEVFVTVTASSPALSTINLPVSLRGVSAAIGYAATDDVDPSLLPISLVMMAGTTTSSFSVPIRDDDLPDSGETFEILFGTPSSGVMSASTLTVLITDDDPPPATISAASTAAAPTEGGSVPVTFTIMPNGAGGSGTVKLPVTFAGSSAIAGVDFDVRTAVGTTATPLRSGDRIDVPAGGGPVTLYVTTLADDVYEGPETFELRVGRAGVLGEQASTSVTIPDDDPVPTVTIVSSVVVAENARFSAVSLQLSGRAAMPLTFDVTVGSGRAPAAAGGGVDFRALSARLTVAAGAIVSSSTSWEVVDDDDYLEPDNEYVTVSAAPVGNPVAPASREVAIADDDADPMFVSLPSMRVREGGSIDVQIGIVPQTAGTGSTGTVRVPVRVAAGTASTSEVSIRQVLPGVGLGSVIQTSGSKVELPANGGLVTLRISGATDSVFELAETVKLIVGRSSVPGELAQRDIVIDDGQARPQVTIQVFDMPAGGFPEATSTVRLQLRLLAAVSMSLPFRVRTVDDSASSGEDFAALDQVITVPAGSTSSPVFTVALLDDVEWDEDTESFSVEAVLESFADARALVSVVNDDVPSLVQFDRGDGRPTPIGETLPAAIRRVQEAVDREVQVDIPVLRRSGSATGELTVKATLVPGTADERDARLESPTVTFASGQTTAVVTLIVTSDSQVEGLEQLQVRLVSPDYERVRRIDDTVTVDIVDVDPLTVTARVTPTVDEGGFVTIEATIDRAVDVDVAVPLSFRAGSATVGAVDEAGGVDVDTTGVPGSVIIDAGSTSGSFRLPIDDDDVPEPSETFTVVFSAPSLGRFDPGATQEFTVTIADDDPPPLRLSLPDATVTEGTPTTVVLEVAPTVPGGSGTLAVPLRLVGLTGATAGLRVRDASSGVDLLAAGSVSVPKAGGTVSIELSVVDDRAFTPSHTVQLEIGRSFALGEQVRATITVVDDEPPPTVRLRSIPASSESVLRFPESAGVVSLRLEISGIATVPITYRVMSEDDASVAEEGADYLALDLFSTIPAGELVGPPMSFTILDNDTEVEATEYVAVFITAADLPENVGSVVIEDDDTVLARFVRSAGDDPDELVTRSVTERDGESVFLTLPVELVGRPITSAVEVSVGAQSFWAFEEDYVLASSTLVFQPGDTVKNLTVEVFGDDLPEVDEDLYLTITTPDGNELLELSGSGPDGARVVIVNDDIRSRARFTRGPADPPLSAELTLKRTIAERGGASNTERLTISFVGDPITKPTTVTVVPNVLRGAQQSDFMIELLPSVGTSGVTDPGHRSTVSGFTFTVRPGDQPRELLVSVVPDAMVETAEGLVIGLSTESGDELGVIDDIVEISFVDEIDGGDSRSPGERLFDELVAAWNSLVEAVLGWLQQFDLGSAGSPGAPVSQPPLVQQQLAEYFDLGPDTEGLDLPRLPPLAGLPEAPPLPDAAAALAEVCRLLGSAGVTVRASAGSACGGAAASGDDLLRLRLEVTLDDLARAAGVDLADLGPEAQQALAGLASGLGLESAGSFTGEFSLVLDAGIDGDGAFVSPETKLDLAVSGQVELSGSAQVAGSAARLEGAAAADFAVSLTPAAGDGHDLARGLVTSIAGESSLQLAATVGPVALDWEQRFVVRDGRSEPEAATLAGGFTPPSLQQLGVPAQVQLVGSRRGDIWHLESTVTPTSSFTLAGFAVDEVAFSADVGPSTMSGSGSLSLATALPGAAGAVDVTIAAGRDSVAFTGRLALDEMELGAPALLRVVDPVVTVDLAATLPGGALSGSIGLAAASAVLLPAAPVGSATGLDGSLSSTGKVTLRAARATARFAGGAASASASDALLTVGPGAGDVVLRSSVATASIAAFDGLTLTVRDLSVSKTGAVGASSVEVVSSGFAEQLGLGGMVPFDITAVNLDFPDRTNIDRFTATVTGRFDFAALGDLGEVVPRLGLGGPVVTPMSPPAQNRFSFSLDVASLASGVIAPLDVGPLTIGFDGLRSGEMVLGGDVVLGGYRNGEFVAAVSGAFRLDGPAGSVLDNVALNVTGTFDPDADVVADLVGSAEFTGALGGITVDRLGVRARLAVRLDDGRLHLEPRLERLTARRISVSLGSLMTLRAESVEFNVSPTPGGNLLTLGSPGGTVMFDEGISQLAGWGGTFSNLAIGTDYLPRLLPGFSVDVKVPADFGFGLPDFVPLRVDSVGVTFPSAPPIGAGGVVFDDSLLEGMRLRVSGGLRATESWPIEAGFTGLEVDLARVARGEFPITNLDAVSMGVAPFTLPGDMRVGGGLTLGTVEVDGTTVFYGRIRGELAVAGIGGGVDLVVTQYGPVLLKVTAPLGIPLGPTGLVLANVSGAAQFGGTGVPVPPRGDPLALLNVLTFPGDTVIDGPAIARAVGPVVRTGRPLWQQGFSLSLSGKVVAPAFPGLLDGTLTVGINLGLPTGPNDPDGVQLVGAGNLSTFGMPLGRVGMMIDLSDPTAPRYDLAYSSPVLGSPLALVMPARTTFGIQLDTKGVVLGTVAGMRAFLLSLTDGVAAGAEQMFDVVLDQVAVRLEADRRHPLAVLLLDLDGNGSVSAAEGAQRITRTWVVDRLLGRAAVPGLLPTSVSAQDLTRAGSAAMELMNVVLMAANDVLTHPERYGTFTLQPAGSGSAFTGLIGTGGAALAALAEIIRSATAQGLSAFGDLFDPSLTITGALQPTFLGLPLGDPTVGGTLQLDRTGLYLEFEGSLTELSKAAASSSFPGGAPALNGILSSATLGVSDRMSIGARLPVGGLIDTLIAGGTLPTFQPLDPNWAVTMSGSITVFGFDTANVSGIAFLPGQRNLLNSKVQKLYELPEGTPIDPRLFPVSTRERFESLVTYGGLLVTASLNLPRLVTDPAAQLAAVPPPPDDITQYPAWLEQVARLAGQVDSAARIQMFVPGLIGVSDTSATAWASSMYVEGVYNGRLLGFQLGRATMQVSPAGLEVEGAIPLIGGRTTMVLNTGLLSGGTRLPSVGVDTSLDSQAFRDTLVRAGMPAAFVPSAGVSGRFRMYTPGANPSSTDPLLRNGGMQLSGRLDLPGLVTGAMFDTELVARGGGFDLHARAEVDRIGPLGGVTIDDAFIDLDVVDGIGSVRIGGSTAVLGARATVSGTLASDLTGTLTLTVSSGTMDLAGTRVGGQAQLTFARSAGTLRASLTVLGTATLPSWLATAAGRSTLSVAACVDSTGSMEVALGMPALSFGPGRLVTVGRAPTTTTLPPSPAACTLPTGAPAQSATGPLFRLRSVGGVPSAVLSGSLTFAGDGAVAGLTVSGSLDGLAGTGSLAVTFAAGGMRLGGFSVSGSATATIGSGTFSLAVTGGLTIPGLITDASVTGTADQRGISSLTVAADSLRLDPLSVSTPTLSLSRSGSAYSLVVGATVAFTGIGSVRVNGSLDSSGFGALTLSTDRVTVAGASITDGTFQMVRSASGMQMSVEGTFELFGAALEVPEASLTLSRSGGVATIAGNLTVRPAEGAELQLGGWTFGGTLRLAFSATSSRLALDNGTVTIPGWGAIGVTVDVAVPVRNGASFSLRLPTGGLRLGGGSSPFFASGSFALGFNGNVASLSATNPSLSWRVGTSTVATFSAPSVVVRSDGFVSARMNGFSASLAGFAFSVPSLDLLIDPQGLNARLSLGAGSIAVPGLPVLSTPAFTIGTAPSFSVPLVANSLTLGPVSFSGRILFERNDDVFRLVLQAAPGSASPQVAVSGLFTVPIPSITIASDGTFSFQVAVPSFGPTGLQITDASFSLAKTGSRLTDLRGSIAGGVLRAGGADPINLPVLSFVGSDPFDTTFRVPGWDLGPALRVSNVDLRLRQTSTGPMELSLVAPASVTVIGESGLTINSLRIDSGGSFTGSVTGKLRMLGAQLAQATLDLSRSGGVVTLSLPASRPATLNLGFLQAQVSGFVRSDGTFDFDGSASAGMSFTVFSFSGSLAVSVSSSDGVTGSFAGSACFAGVCANTGASLRSDGRIRGFLQIDAYGGPGLEVDIDWRIYLATGALTIDINRDGDYDDFGDVWIGDVTDADSTPPTMTQPPDLEVSAKIPTDGTVRVYFDNPTAYDGSIRLSAVCSPGSGSLFPVGVTTVTCTARDRAGNTRTRTFKVTVISTNASRSFIPATDLVAAVSGTGFAANTMAGMWVRSSPVFLGLFPTDAEGRVTVNVALPPDLPPGEHTLILEGMAPDGGARQVVQPIVVVGPPTDTPPTSTVPPSPTTPPPTTSGMSSSDGATVPTTAVASGGPTTAVPATTTTARSAEESPVVASGGPTTTAVGGDGRSSEQDGPVNWTILLVLSALVLLLGAVAVPVVRRTRQR
jgi:hypothetical protein